ncbi:NAD(P)-binding protein [Acephala macrosclerotiorum]|nr:NAD(P)-binding protein [Acephala macrosclerotiorum]
MELPSYTKTYHTSSYPAISPTLPSLSTSGKVVFITGGGSGIGASIALSFAASGSHAIALLGRIASNLQAVKSQIKEQYPKTEVVTFVADITDKPTVDTAFSSMKHQFGGIDILVQNAAYLPTPEPISTFSISEYFSGMEINLKGNLILTQAFLANRTANKEAVLIHVTSAGVHMPGMPVSISAYIASKIAGAKMMEYLAVELKEKGVKVVSVHPGVHDTVQGKRAGEAGLVMPFDDAKLPGDFMVWAASPEADFLHGKLVWANWDVDELKARKKEITAGPALTLGLVGWP